MKKIASRICLLCCFIVMLVSCVTSTLVTFNTSVPGADVYVDGEHIGKTPTEKKMSNGVWEDAKIIIKKEGYQDLHTNVQKDIKPVNLIIGLLLWWPSLLWVHGPKSQQNYLLTPLQ